MRRVVKHKPNVDVAAFKREYLGELERLWEQDKIDLFYGDESRVCLQPCVPYAWQFRDEQAGIPSTRSDAVGVSGAAA